MSKRERWGPKHVDDRDWKQYNEHLIKRGEFYINPVFLETWQSEVDKLNNGKVGQPYQYPESLIEFLAILYSRSFDYRSLQGILRGLSRKLGPFPVICFSQIRRRILLLPISFKRRTEDLIVAVDGSGMKVGNRGEWIRHKWKVKRGWVKVVILGDSRGNVVDVRVGNEDLDERAAGRGLIRANKKCIKKVLMDGYHDCKDTFELCEEESIETGIKIRSNASNKGFGRRPREVRMYQGLGYEDWSKAKGYGFRWVGSEGIFSAVKRMLGEGVRSHRKRNMYHEAKLKFWSYQRLKSVV